jgi:hypothetical protein
MEYCNVVVIKNGVVDECVLVTGRNRPEVSERAESLFLERCASVSVTWGQYEQSDLDAMLDDGYHEGDQGTVCITWPDAESVDTTDPANTKAYVIFANDQPQAVTRNKGESATFQTMLNNKCESIRRKFGEPKIAIREEEVEDLDCEPTGIPEIDNMTPIRSREILAGIFEYMFLNDDGIRNPDKPIEGADFIAHVTDLLPRPNCKKAVT